MQKGHERNGRQLFVTVAPVCSPERREPRRWYTLPKTAFDVILALVLFVLTLPLMLVLAALVKLTSRGPALYAQMRLGRHGKPYILYKLRTMTHDCERLTGAQWARAHDPRVTAFGRLLRKTHLDELPQLWNVLSGHMSLVGPRPERPEFVPGLARAIPQYPERLQVKPGVTGLAQVKLPADTDLDSVRAKLAYDLHYIDHMGFWLDFRIILCTGLKMLGLPFRILTLLFRFPTLPAVASHSAEEMPASIAPPEFSHRLTTAAPVPLMPQLALEAVEHA